MHLTDEQRALCVWENEGGARTSNDRTLPTNPILITDADRRRLTVGLSRLCNSGRGRRENSSSLRRRIERAEIVRPTEIPRNVVTLNSRFVLKDLDSRRRLVCTLAEPWDHSPPGDRVSVSGPAGTALLGSRVGQIVRWRVGAHDRRFRIEQLLYQSEAAGDRCL